MKIPGAGWILLLGICSIAPVASAQTVSPDYSQSNLWLCRGNDSSLGACAIDMTATIVNADGYLEFEYFAADPAAPVDCFYIYPTASTDNSSNSDLIPGDEEFHATAHQFARFASRCRPFAPMYRQGTLTALLGNAPTADFNLAYGDVRDAWNYYLAHFNTGRGVVLIGHSQGASMLTRLVAEEIDGKTVQQRILSAMLLGTTIQVAYGQTVGGTFQHMPLCTQADQLACIITYVSFRDDLPPDAGSNFGRHGLTTTAACTNPAQLAFGSADLHAYLNGSSTGRSAYMHWTAEQPLLTTTFARVPDLLSAECVSNASHQYLAVTVHGNPSDPRTDDIGGDVLIDGQRSAQWGLHSIDVGVAMGDLLELVRRQSEKFAGPATALSFVPSSPAVFIGSAKHQGTATAASSFTQTDSIDVQASITIAPDDVGTTGQLFVVVRYNDTYYLKTSTGFIPFAVALENLVSFAPPRVLQATESVEIVAGLTGLTGSFQVFTAYSNGSRQLRYALDPIAFTVSDSL